jgi:hypothetical protein
MKLEEWKLYKNRSQRRSLNSKYDSRENSNPHEEALLEINSEAAVLEVPMLMGPCAHQNQGYGIFKNDDTLPQSPTPSIIPAEKWDAARPLIQTLYMENKSFLYVASALYTEHGFYPT